MRKILKNETVLVLFFSFLLIGLSFYPTIYEAFQANNLGDSRRVLLWGEHNFTYDYNVYLTKIRQGMEGRWTVINKYTSEPHRGSFLQEFYLLAGKVGGWLGLTPPLAYHLLRLVLAVGYLLAIYWLVSYFLPDSKTRMAAFLLALFSGGFPKIQRLVGSWRVSLWFDWWQEMDQIKRATYVPHYVLGHLLTIVCLLLLLQVEKTKKFSVKRRLFLGATAAGALAGFVHPPSLLIVWGIIGFWTLFNKFKSLKNFLLFVFFSALPLFYVSRITSIYPWKSIVDYDQANPWSYSLKEYLLSLGPTLPLGLAGLAWVSLKRKFSYLPLVFWVMTVPLGMMALKVLGSHSELYFIQVAVYLPLAILSALILARFRKPEILAGLVLLVSLPVLIASEKGQIQFVKDRLWANLPLVPYPSQVMYPLKDWWQGIVWLGENTSWEQIVLSEQTAGNYIPAYAGNTVYIGHVSETVNFRDKKAIADRFFAGKMLPIEMQEFLTQNRISYVFFDPQAAELGNIKPKSYYFLKPVYESQYVTILSVLPK